MRLSASTRLAVLLTLGLTCAAQARPLTNLELYRRCFAQLTGHRIDLNDALTKSVVNGSVTPLAACGQVLDSAVLSTNDTANAAIRVSPTAPAYAQAVLANMHKLHMSFFQVKDFIPADGLRPTRSKGTMDLFDNSTPAMYLTRALLSPPTSAGAPQFPFAGIVAGKDLLGAVRTNMDPQAGPRTGYPKSFYSMTSAWKYAPTGALQGLRTLQPSSVNFNLATNHGGASDSSDEYTPFTLPLLGSQTRDGSIGGGILGNYVYVMLNVQGSVVFDKYAKDDSGLPSYLAVDFLSDGALRMPRKWGRAVYHDFLCRDLPAIRVGDGDAFLENGVNGAPPFRQSSTCLACHASIDRTSSVVRHVVYRGFGTGPEVGNSGSTATDWYRGYEGVDFKATSGTSAFSWPATSDPSFGTKAPAGVLFFRNYLGVLVEQPVSDVNALGSALAQQDDLYVCAAKRYFAHFTGIVANIGDVDPSTLGAGDQAARNAVITLGKALRQHNDLRQLAKDIMALPLYRDSSYLVAP